MRKIGKHAHFPTWQWKVPSAETHFFVKFQWRISRNFKTGERGRILRSGVCFDRAPSHIRYIFVVRVVNKIHTVNIVCWLKSPVIVKIYKKTNTKHFSNLGGRSSVRFIGFTPKMKISNLNDWTYLAASIELPQILPQFLVMGTGSSMYAISFEGPQKHHYII